MQPAAIWAEHHPYPEPLWYAVHTRGRHEDAVSRRLAGRSFETFLPKLETWSRRRDRRQLIHLPLFPGYLFVKVSMDRYVWSEIVRTSGVVQVLGNAQGCVPVPEPQIESVRTLLADSLGLSPHPYLQVGRRVRVVAGPLAGCEGILIKKSDRRSRLIVAVDIIRQAVSVEMDAADVEPV
jgi:transcriptional antiterminator NusG